MSLSTLKRRLADYGLTRKSCHAPVAIIWNLIHEELQGPGAIVFYIVDLRSFYTVVQKKRANFGGL